MKKLLILLFSILSIFYFAQLSPLEKTLQDAEFHYNRSEYDLAIQYYKEYFKSNQSDYQSYDRLGVCYYRLKDYKNAQENFRRAALLCPVNEKQNLAGYYSNLSAAYSNLDDNEKAFLYAMKAYNLDATQLTLFNAVSMSNNISRCEEGLKILEKSQLPKKNSGNALYGICYYKQGKFEESIQYFEEFLSNYNSETETADFIIVDERINLLKSYLSSAAETDKPLPKERTENIAKLYVNIVESEVGKEKVLNLFADKSSSWNKSERSKDLINNLLEKTPGIINIKTKIGIALAQNNLKQMFELSDNYLKNNAIADEQKLFALNTARYFAYLFMIIDENSNSNLQILESDLFKLKNYFNDIYGNKQLKNDELTKKLLTPLETTFELFRKISKTKEDEKRFAKILQKIVGDFPNPTISKEMNALLDAGRLEN